MMTSSLCSFTLFLSLFFSHVFASQSGLSEGANVLFSSQISLSSDTSLSIEVLNLANPQIQANGQYSEIVIEKATAIFLETLDKNAVEMFALSSSQHSVFTVAYEEVVSHMEVNFQVLLPAVLVKLAAHYTDIASKYNRSKAELVPGSRACKKRTDITKLIIVLVQEILANGGKFTDDQRLVLLEFIYRFIGTDYVGDRYGFAIQGLYVSLQMESFSDFFEIIINYFDRNRIALPVFFFNIIDDTFLPLKGMFMKISFRSFMESYNTLM